MPIEIKELHIRVAVSAPAGAGAPAGAPTPAAAGDVASREAIVAECVERVVELLRDREER